jgi:hypothetical protein
MTRLLRGDREHNYIAPFVKLTPRDTKESIEEKMKRLSETGIRSMVLEYGDMTGGLNQVTPFDDALFVRMRWISDLCVKYGMTFFIQDAAPFPTGAANGILEQEGYGERNKVYLDERHLDAFGPAKGRTFLINQLIHCTRGSMDNAEYMQKFMNTEPELLAVVALPRRNGKVSFQNPQILTHMVKDGILRWDIPKGSWRIYCLLKTTLGGREHYINLLDKESVKLLVDQIHVPTYKAMEDVAGKTWLGFFYDEAEVGNVTGYHFDAALGTAPQGSGTQMVLPWSATMPGLCQEAFGEEWAAALPFLWYESDDDAFRRIRYTYMRIISGEISRHYNGQVYEFCKKHGILYFGHNLEDENSHARLGCGPVHYFRMQKYQDMAGIDLVGGQIMPGCDEGNSWYGAVDGDGEFYHYGLAKLASSAARVQPNKKGKSLVEDFALYGSVADPKIRKFVIDHLLVNGINHFVHADPFGTAISDQYLEKLNHYTNGMCEWLQGGVSHIRAAVLYHAEAEWSGAYQLFQKPARELARHQISYDVVPADVFEEREFYLTDTSKGLKVNGHEYGILIVPYSEFVPACVGAFLKEAQKSGFPVIFTDAYPKATIEDLAPFEPCDAEVVSLSRLAARVKEWIGNDVELSGDFPYMRVMRFEKDGRQCLFLHNEDPRNAADFVLECDIRNALVEVDFMEDKMYAPDAKLTEKGSRLNLHLEALESVLLTTVSGEGEVLAKRRPRPMVDKMTCDGVWDVTGSPCQLAMPFPIPGFPVEEKQPFHLQTEKLGDIYEMIPDKEFAGTVKYQIEITPDRKGYSVLDLGEVYGSCQASLNGRKLGTRLSAPYLFDVSEVLVDGTNHLEIEVELADTRRVPKGFEVMMSSLCATVYSALDPGGLIGPVCLG